MTVLSYYKGSLARALLDLFPNIGLDPKQFVHVSSMVMAWKREEKEERRERGEGKEKGEERMV